MKPLKEKRTRNELKLEAAEARVAELEMKYAEISEEHTRRVEEIADLRVRIAEIDKDLL